jgi:hypothetical protein
MGETVKVVPSIRYSRGDLIKICERAIVPVDKWRNRDTPSSQRSLGICLVMLKAGCRFKVIYDGGVCSTDEFTIWLEIGWPSFHTFEYGSGYENSGTFYLPTQKRLDECKGGDWY